jgi:hypothetical protein
MNMFNRAVVERSNFLKSLLVGVASGAICSRDGYDVFPLMMPLMAIYACMRYPGDVQQRGSRMLGLVVGMFIGAYAAENLRENYPKTSVPRPRLG